MGGKYDNKEGDLNCAHPTSRVWEYKRGSDITKGGIMKVRVHLHSLIGIVYKFVVNANFHVIIRSSTIFLGGGLFIENLYDVWLTMR